MDSEARSDELERLRRRIAELEERERDPAWPSEGGDVFRQNALYVSGYSAEALGRQGVLAAGGALVEKPSTVMGRLGKIREVLGG